LSQVIVRRARDKGLDLAQPDNFWALPGRGIEAIVAGKQVLLGNARLMQERHIDPGAMEAKSAPLFSQGKTVMFLTVDGKVAGIIALADTLKPNIKEAILDLHRMGVETIMITGDNRRTADAIAQEAGIDNVIAEVLPEHKAAEVKKLQQGRIVAMVGDGINDAPALAQADVGIAIGTGTDIAIESAAITLISGDLMGVVTAIKLSKRTMQTIRQNLFWAFAYNVILIR